MKPGAGLVAAPRSATRMFAVYAVISLIPVLALGVLLGGSYRHAANQRGLAEGRSQAALLARTAVAPILSGADLTKGLSPAEQHQLAHMGAAAIGTGQVVQLRLRNE